MTDTKYGKYAEKSLKDLKGSLKKLTKQFEQLQNKTSKKNFDAAREKKSAEITKLKYELARISYKTREKNDESDALRDMQKQKKLQMEESNNEYKAAKNATDELKSTYNVSNKISNPSTKLKDLTARRTTIQRQLMTEDISHNSERSLRRQIADLESEIERVKAYIDEKGEEKWNKIETKKVNQNEKKKTQDQKFKEWKAAKEKADEHFQELTDLQRDSRLCNEKIKGLNKDLDNLKSDFKNNQREKQKVEEELKWLRSKISQLENSEKVVPEKGKKKEVKGKKEKSDAAQGGAKNSAPQGKDVEKEEGKKISLAQRREAAQKEYEQMRKKFLAQNAEESTENSSPGTEVVEKKSDPHLQDKKLCRTLIALCENMKPPAQEDDSPKKKKKRKRKKKKARLTHAPSTMSEFFKIGVEIPLFADDLQGTIDALNKKIVDYDTAGNTENEQ